MNLTRGKSPVWWSAARSTAAARDDDKQGLACHRSLADSDLGDGWGGGEHRVLAPERVRLLAHDLEILSASRTGQPTVKRGDGSSGTRGKLDVGGAAR